MRFQDKVAIVTGGASGIGAATVLGLSKEGPTVVVADWDSENLQMEAEMKKKARPFLALKLDVSSEKDIQKRVNQTVSYFGASTF
jgi:NAD(P)-dependent dehydrogenase (short-subunit alcohol dehydrogenase family)